MRFRRKPIGEIPDPEDGIEVYCIEIDHFIGMTGIFKSFGELLQHSMTKRLRIRMRINGQNFHRSLPNRAAITPRRV